MTLLGKNISLDRSGKDPVTFCARSLIFIVSVAVVLALVLDYGFVLDESERRATGIVYKFSWWFFFSLYLLEIFFKRNFINRHSLAMTIVMASLLLLSLLAKFIFPLHVFANNTFTSLILGLFSIIEISRGVVRLINKKSNPALLLSGTFLVLIIIGTILLLVPRSTLPHIRLSIVDSLFVATSAVCVTGLSPVDISSTFTLGGQLVILVLIQIGALGVMTVTSFFTLFYMGETGLFSQFALKDMIGSDTFSSLFSTLLYIVGFTFAIETAGVLLLWLSIHGTLGMSLQEELFFSIFHSISAFCNAGFSTLEGNLGNGLIMNGHNMFYLFISLLIVLGSIGFPILVNFKDILLHLWRRYFWLGRKGELKEVRYAHMLTLNTKMVLYMTAILIIAGALSIALFEWNRAFANMEISDKIIHSIFNAIAPRTAGFNSVDLASFSILSIILYSILMWIGGASQSTAGGIKVNTFMVAAANFLSILKGSDNCTVFKREVTYQSIRRASAIIFGSLSTIFLFWFILIILEPGIRPYRLLFETISAISTVGSSLDLTPQLGSESKVLLSLLMYVGRVGLITILTSLMQTRRTCLFRYPQESVIIN